LALAPGDRDARINSAVLDLKMASPDGAAVRRLSAHLLDDPNDAAAWDLLASALEAEGATGDALRASERAAHLEPANWKFRFNLGTSLLKAGRSDEAREILRAARELAPGRPEIRLNLAAAELAAGDLGAAKATYRDILGRWPGEPRATAALARLGGSGEDMAGH
jgi:Flp pilus assembly protein TadD